MAGGAPDHLETIGSDCLPEALIRLTYPERIGADDCK